MKLFLLTLVLGVAAFFTGTFIAEYADSTIQEANRHSEATARKYEPKATGNGISVPIDTKGSASVFYEDGSYELQPAMKYQATPKASGQFKGLSL